MTESTDKVAVGNLTGMEPRSSGWFRFTVQEAGKQYPLRLDTKKPELVEQCKALMGSSVKVAYSERPSENLNPNTQQPYTNRYLDKIAAAAPGDVSSQGDQGAGAQQQQARPAASTGGNDAVRELRIMRTSGSQRATEMLAAGLLPDHQRNMAGLVEVAEAWVAYYVYGAARFGVEAFDSSAGGGEPQDGPGDQPAEEQQQLIPDVCAQCGWKEGQHAKGCPNGTTDDDIPF